MQTDKEKIQEGGYICHECATKNKGNFQGGTCSIEPCILCGKEEINAPTTDYNWPWHKQKLWDWD